MNWDFFNSLKTSIQAFLLLITCLFIQPVAADHHSQNRLEEADEYALKAVFLFNLAKFISWPKTAFPQDTATHKQTFKFCILGKTLFNGGMKAIIEAEKVRSRSIKVEKDIALNEASYECQIIFISRREEKRLPQILKFYRGRPILTVSDLEHFAHKQGMVEFYQQDERIRLAINAESLREAKLKASANLLRVAKVLAKTNQKP